MLCGHEPGKKRLKCTINIDMNSIPLCDDTLLARLEKIHLPTDYIGAKRKGITAYDSEHSVDEDCLVNGRRPGNAGSCHACIVACLRQHPMINRDMTFLVRRLTPTPHGSPLQIHVSAKPGSGQITKRYRRIFSISCWR